ncbi:MAG: tRNA (adenosine(37)-N6)-threonylcarbamoyltransferase complex ATPase subunit type 1 TsaE [bacterium]|nr:tRNA (adenosine(37)-N6)-threonylcarbamoyltransferase complex ATPase subunit type 1 TsaE [Candidatus Aquidulcis frankliniae]
MNVVTIALDSLAATTALGAAIGASLRPGDRVLLSGDLGSGKTTLARSIGVALHAEPELTSPTFILVAEHRGDLPIWHVDAYRLPVGSDALRAGVIDERQMHGVTLIEWPEHLAGLADEGPGILHVHLAVDDRNDARSAVIRGARPDLHAGLSTIVDPSESGRG